MKEQMTGRTQQEALIHDLESKPWYKELIKNDYTLFQAEMADPDKRRALLLLFSEHPFLAKHVLLYANISMAWLYKELVLHLSSHKDFEVPGASFQKSLALLQTIGTDPSLPIEKRRLEDLIDIIEESFGFMESLARRTVAERLREIKNKMY